MYLPAGYLPEGYLPVGYLPEGGEAGESAPAAFAAPLFPRPDPFGELDWDHPLLSFLGDYWPLWERAGAARGVRHPEYAATLASGATWTAEGLDCAAGGYADLLDPSHLTVSTGEATLEAWVRARSVPAGVKVAGVLARATDGPVQRVLSLDVAPASVPWAGCIVFQTYDGTNNPAVIGPVVTDGLWHHVVGVRDRAGGFLWLYVDGRYYGRAADTSGNLDGGNPQKWSIGRRADTDFGQALNGVIGLARVWRTGLSASWIGDLYHHPHQMLLPSLMERWMDLAVFGIAPYVQVRGGRLSPAFRGGRRAAAFSGGRQGPTFKGGRLDGS